MVIYTWKGNNKDFIKRLNDNILIRTLPILRYFQKIQAYIFYHIWLKIDNPSNVIFNFLSWGIIFTKKFKLYLSFTFATLSDTK